MRACLVGILVGLAAGCTDRPLSPDIGQEESGGSCVGVNCPCDSRDDCPPTLICVAGLCSATCGNGTIEPGEQCDHGDADDLDGCNAFCLVPGTPTWSTTVSVQAVSDVAIAADQTLALVGHNYQETATAWTARMDGAGAIMWERAEQAPSEHGSASAHAVAIAEDGDVVSTGELEPGALWVQRYAPDGSTRWATTWARDDGEPFRGHAISAVDDEVVVIATDWRGDRMGLVALQLDADGEETWRLDLMPDTGLFDAWALATSASGDAWVAGAWPDPQGGAWLGHFTVGSALLDAQVLAEGPQTFASAVSVMSDGNIAVAGTDFDVGWVRALTPSGQPQWSWTLDVRGLVLDLAIDGAGSLVVAGQAGGGWVSKLTSDGALAWTFLSEASAETAGIELFRAVAVDDAGFVYAVGQDASAGGVVIKIAP